MKFLLCLFFLVIFSKDLTIVGITKYNDGLGRISLGIAEYISKDLSINIINTKDWFVALDEEEINHKVLDILKENDFSLGKTIFFTELITTLNYLEKIKESPEFKSKLRIVLSMFETTKLPSFWVKTINDNFDIVVVPDNFLVNVYKESGINIPIFVLPIGLYLDEFKTNTKKTYSEKFVFGCLSRFQSRKNQIMLLEAFAREFSNNSNVILKLHGRFENQDKEIISYIKKNNLKNVEITSGNLSWDEYINLMCSIDCYINISKGEGYSITPRESLAAGIPTIITNNTAQINLVNSQYYYSIDCPIIELADYCDLFSSNEYVGYWWNCKINDVCRAIKDIYFNYDFYKIKALEGSLWVRKFSWNNMIKYYEQLFRPLSCELGDDNLIMSDKLITNSYNLYKKINEIIANEKI